VGAAWFFLAQVITAAAWTTPYHWSANNISDLGNVLCQNWGEPPRYVCSPRHGLMNGAIVLYGLLQAVGVILSSVGWPHRAWARVARGLVLVTSAAWVVVGLTPADVDENLHVLCAVVIFFVGNAGLILVSLAVPATRAGRIAGGCLGAIGLVAAPLFLEGHYFGLGMGGMERVTAFPFPLALLGLGSSLLRRPAAA
jgi:hypothetical membrane protein